jgi:DNA-binding transcriptional LysR family regulator
MAEDARHALHTCIERHVSRGYIRSVSRPDLNLLVALDVLLAEGSVARAARRLQLSPSAMSRTLARLRASTGDPLLVRAGRALVATPRAHELRERVGQLVQEGESVLRPTTETKPADIARTFTLRTGEGFVESFGPALLRRASKEAPRVRLRFLPKLGRDSGPLREGAVDLETGVVGKATGPEVRAQTLFRDRFIGVVRAGHPLAKGCVTPSRYAAAKHVEVWQHVRGGPVDAVLQSLGLEREIGVVVGGFASALTLARSTDFVASVPERHTGSLRAGMRVFALPFAAPEVTVSMLWHPRLDADPAHRWLRRCVREVCVEASGSRARSNRA